MATVEFRIDPLWYGIDNTQRRIIVQGEARILPDDPDNPQSAYTYTPGGIRAIWSPLEPIKATNLMPLWVEMESLGEGSTVSYRWAPGAPVTAVEIDGGTLTVTANNNFAVNDEITFRYLTGDADVLNGWGLAVTPHKPLRITEASATEFEGTVGILELDETETTGFAVPVRYGPLVPPPLPPTLPSNAPMGSVKIMSGDSEVTSIDNPNDVIICRAEFMRSYQ